MRSVIQRYQAGDRNMRGKTGPSMKILPKKLPKNRVITKYRPRADTAIWGEMEMHKCNNKSFQYLINGDVRHYWHLWTEGGRKKIISLIIAKGAVLLFLWQIFPQTVETPGQTFLLRNVNKGIFLSGANKLWVHVLITKYQGDDEMEGCTDGLTPLNMEIPKPNRGMNSVNRNPHRPDEIFTCLSVWNWNLSYWFCNKISNNKINHYGCQQHVTLVL